MAYRGGTLFLALVKPQLRSQLCETPGEPEPNLNLPSWDCTYTSISLWVVGTDQGAKVVPTFHTRSDVESGLNIHFLVLAQQEAPRIQIMLKPCCPSSLSLTAGTSDDLLSPATHY